MLTKSFPLFRLFGFKVQLDLSILIIAFLLIWTLSASFFPMLYPNLAASTYIWMGVLGVLGLFISIVIHEFFHALVGKQFGLPIGGITLFVFGGVAEMKEEPSSPKAEFWMAIAGPLASLGIAGITYLLYDLAVEMRWPVVLTGILNYLWQINLVLLVFNLIPAFPLDGGRVLRAILWKWKGEIQWATKISATIGSGFGMVLVLLGILAFFGGNPIGGIWYFVIGIFLRMMAQSSYRMLMFKSSLTGETVERFMNPNPITVPSDASITDLVDNYILRYHHKMFPVVENERVVGSVSIREVNQIAREEWDSVTVSSIMRPCNSENTVQSGSDVSKIIGKIVAQPHSYLLVVDNDSLKGIINTADILKFIAIKLELGEGSHEAGSREEPESLHEGKSRSLDHAG